MGKPNRSKRPERTPRYTGKNIDPMGDATRMGRFAVSLFKDMCHGKFDFNKNISVFQNREFINSAIVEVNNKLRENSTYLIALNYTYGASNDLVVAQLIERHTKAIEGWEFIKNILYMILNSGDISLVYGLLNRLPDYKNVIS